MKKAKLITAAAVLFLVLSACATSGGTAPAEKAVVPPMTAEENAAAERAERKAARERAAAQRKAAAEKVIAEASEIVVTREDSATGIEVEVSVDGGMSERLFIGRTEVFKVPNGNYVVSASGKRGYSVKTRYAKDGASTAVSLNHERVVIVVKASESDYDETISVSMRVTNRVSLPKPALPPEEDPFEEADISFAVQDSFAALSPLIPPNARIGIVNIASANSAYSEVVVEDLTLLLVNTQKFIVVDRKTLDAVRAEQNLQMSGDVDDKSAVGIGHLIGAEFVITGSISTSNQTSRLRIKVLNVETGQIIAMSSESI